MTELPRTTPLYLSTPHPCSYLEGHTARTLFIDPDAQMTNAIYGHLLTQGFRRSGRLVYTQRCEGCRQCISVRVPVNKFSHRRRHRRIVRANADIRSGMANFELTEEHYDLYRRYTAARHSSGEMAHSTINEVDDFLRADWSDTRFIEFHLDGRLVCVAVTDVFNDALSAVYTFFDPELEKHSLGTHAILTQIQLAKERGLSHLYLGYWVAGCQKMAYKQDFRPIEVISQQHWHRFASGESIAIAECGGN